MLSRSFHSLSRCSRVSPLPSTSPYALQLVRSFRRNRKQKLNVILMEDIPGVGYKGEEVGVQRGFARNNLFPKNRAVYANEAAKNDLFSGGEVNLDLEAIERQREEDKLKARLQKITLDFRRQRDAEDRNKLYSEVNAANIVKNLFKKYQIEVDESQVKLPADPAPIKTFGEHSVNIEFANMSEPIAFKVNVVKR